MRKVLITSMLTVFLYGCVTISDHETDFVLTANLGNKSICNESNIKLYTYVKGSTSQDPQKKRELSGFYLDSNRNLHLTFTHGWGEKSGFLVKEQTKLIVIELHCDTLSWRKAFIIDNRTSKTNNIELVWN